MQWRIQNFWGVGTDFFAFSETHFLPKIHLIFFIFTQPKLGVVKKSFREGAHALCVQTKSATVLMLPKVRYK